MNDYEFGNYLTDLRKSAGLSQFQLGKLMDVSDKAVSKWENGSARPRMQTCRKLAELYNITVDDLLACGHKGIKADDAEEKFWNVCADRFHERYGDDPPEAFIKRFDEEKLAFSGTGAVELLSLLSEIVIEKEHVESIDTQLTASLAAWLLNITAINPLPPHTYCPHCGKTVLHPEVRDGWDLGDMVCEKCGHSLIRDGHDIPVVSALLNVIPGVKCGIPIDLTLPSPEFEDIRRYIANSPFLRDKYRLLPLKIKYNPITEEDYLYDEALYHAFASRRDEYGEVIPYQRGYDLQINDYALVRYDCIDAFRKKYLNRAISHEEAQALRSEYITVQLSDSVYNCAGRPLDPRYLCRAMRLAVFKDIYLFQKDAVAKYADPKTGAVLIDSYMTDEARAVAKAAENYPGGLSLILQMNAIAGSLWDEAASALIKDGVVSFMDFPVTREHVHSIIISKVQMSESKESDLADRVVLELAGSEGHISSETARSLKTLGFEQWFIDLLSGSLASCLDSKLTRIEEAIDLADVGLPLFRPYQDTYHPRLG